MAQQHVTSTNVRRPRDIILVGIAALFLIAFTFSVLGGREWFTNLEIDLFGFINSMPEWVRDGVYLIMQLGAAAVIPIGAVVAAAFRRFRLAGAIVLGVGGSWILAKVLKVLLGRGRPLELLDDVIFRGGGDAGLGFPSGHAAVAAALATVIHPYIPKRFRWTVWALAGLVGFARIYVGVHFPLDVLGGWALGIMVGSIANLIVGVMGDRWNADSLKEALARTGLDIAEIHPLGDEADARGSVPMRLVAEDGTEFFAKLIGREHRSADALFRAWRTIMLRRVGPHPIYLTPYQEVEHEAYAVHLAIGAGVRSPAVVATATTDDGFGILVQESIEGRTLADLDPEEREPKLVEQILEQLAAMHSAGVAHRDLRTANIMLDDSGDPWIIDYDFATTASQPDAMALDVATTMAMLATFNSPEDVLDRAVDILGEDAVLASFPALEPMAFPSELRESLDDADTDPIEDLKNLIEERLDADPDDADSVVRFDRRKLLWLVGLGLGLYFFIPQLGELGTIAENWRSANVALVLAGLAASVGTYVFAAVSLQGAVRKTLDFGRLALAQVAASFANRLGPRGVGGAVVNERFLEHQGLKTRTAVGAIALNNAAGAVIHLSLLPIMIAITGVGALDDISAVSFVIDHWELVLAALFGIAAVIAVLWKPLDLGDRLRPVKESLGDLRQALTEPKRATQLFGGSALVTASYGFALWFSMMAVGAEVSLPLAFAVYLGADIIASASPTPGGLGIVEGALVAAFTAVGVSAGIALAGVLLYRLLTFWLPIVPGLIAFKYLQANKEI